MKIKLNTIDDLKNFVAICNKYESSIDVNQGRYVINGKSILGVFSLNLMEELNIYIFTNDENIMDDFYDEISKWMSDK